MKCKYTQQNQEHLHGCVFLAPFRSGARVIGRQERGDLRAAQLRGFGFELLRHAFDQVASAAAPRVHVIALHVLRRRKNKQKHGLQKCEAGERGIHTRNFTTKLHPTIAYKGGVTIDHDKHTVPFESIRPGCLQRAPRRFRGASN